jgi:hypothetical protein
MSRGMLYTSGALSSVAIDFMILVAPLTTLWRLKMGIGKKVLVVSVLVCGYMLIYIYLVLGS